MAILTYEELFDFTKEFSKAFEALLSSNMRDWSTVNSITVRGNTNEIAISCYFRTIEYIDSSNSLKDLKDFISNKLISVGRIKFHFDRDEIEISGSNGSIYKRKDGSYELHSPRSNEKRTIASERVEKYFDLLENLILSSKKSFILEKSKSELDRDRFYSNRKIFSDSGRKRFSPSERELFYNNTDSSQAPFHVSKNRSTQQEATTERYIFDNTALAFAVASSSTGNREPTTTAVQQMHSQYDEYRSMPRPRIIVNSETNAERYRRIQNLFRTLPSLD